MNDTIKKYKLFLFSIIFVASYQNAKCQELDTVIVTYRANLFNAITNKYFKTGDSLYVFSGFLDTTTTIRKKKLEKVGFWGNYFSCTDTILFYHTKDSISVFKKYSVFYSYIRIRNDIDTLPEVYVNFDMFDKKNEAIQYRNFTVDLTSSSRFEILINDTVVVENQKNSQPIGPSAQYMSRNVLLTISCDLRPAYTQVYSGDTLKSSNSDFIITRSQLDSIYIWDLYLNGKGFDKYGWLPWGDSLKKISTRKMYDDGTHGDAKANDRIYTTQFMLFKDSSYSQLLGKTFRFSINGYDNEAGIYGGNIVHITNVNDDNSNYVAVGCFGGQIKKLYKYWSWDFDYCGITAIERDENTFPQFLLNQNFPNPFNPNTMISYQLSINSYTTLKVYDALGREAATLVNEKQEPGTYHVSFDAKNLSSGMYFYRLQSGEKTLIKKMTVIK